MADARSSARSLAGAWRLIAAAALLAVSMPSCGGGPVDPGNDGNSNNGSDAAPPQAVDLLGPGALATVEAAGTIDTTEIGGTGLQVLSLHDADGGVVSDAAFTVAVSDAGAQVLIAAGADGAARGMVTSLPTATGASSRAALTIDAESTASAYILLCCGIGSPDLDTCSARIEEIRAFASFPPLVTRLRRDLPTESLAALSDDESFRQLVHAVVSEWYQAHGGQQVLALHNRPDVGVTSDETDDQNWGIRLDFPAATDPEVKVDFRNSAYRAVDVRRRDVSAGGTATWKPISTYSDPSIMAGSLGWSQGDLVVGVPGTSTVVADTMSFAGLARSEYWVAGPGFAASAADLPADWPGPNAGAPAWGVSLAGTTLWPMAAMLAGTTLTETELHESGPAFGANVWAAFGEAPGVLSPIENLIAEGPGWNASRRFDEEKACLQALVGAMSGGTGSSRLADIVTASDAEASALCDALKGAVGALTPAHIVLACMPWDECPAVAVYTMYERDPEASLSADPPAVPADGETAARVTYRLLDDGTPAPGVPVALSTSMGQFGVGGSAVCEGVTDEQGRFSGSLISSSPGKAKVTAQVPGYTGHEAQVEVEFGNVWLSPSYIHSTDQSPTLLQCTVSGVDPADVAYEWKTDKWSWVVEPGTGKAVTDSMASAVWGRKSGEAAESYVRVTALYVGAGRIEEDGDYIGEAQVDIDIDEMRFPVTLMGIVDRDIGAGYTGCTYGCAFSKLERGNAYEFFGSGFNDPVLYGTSYRGSFRVGLDSTYRDLGTQYFYPLSQTGGSYDPRSDEEIIADHSWRFEGGIWYMIPRFCAPYTEPPI